MKARKRLLRQFRRLRLRIWLSRLLVGACLPGALLLAGALILGWTDWQLHVRAVDLPAWARAISWLVVVGTAAVLARRFIFGGKRTDDFSLALQIEKLSPTSGGSLPSAVEFAGADRAEADPLCEAVIGCAAAALERCDFRKLAPRFIPGMSVAALLSAVGLTGLAVLDRPVAAQGALWRVLVPYDRGAWPTETRVFLDAVRSPVARGDVYEVRASVGGLVPEQAVVEYEGTGHTEEVCAIERNRLNAQLGRVDHSFRFRVRVNDAVTAWQEVEVLPPPQLLALGTRRSPCLSLHPPLYTGLKTQPLPGGVGDVEAVAGTEVHFECAVDRPLAQAWIDFVPANRMLGPAAHLAILGSGHQVGVLGLEAAAHRIKGVFPVRLESNRRFIEADFVPLASGSYTLQLLDFRGLRASHTWEVRLLADPRPVVHLQAPEVSPIDVLPDSIVTVPVSAEDREFGLRAVWLECLLARPDAPRAEVLCNPRPRMIHWPAPGPRRISHVFQLSLNRLRHAGGAPLQAGDLLTIEAVANDFDDVTFQKPPARSATLHLRVVTPDKLRASMERAGRDAVRRLRQWAELERQAQSDAATALSQWGKSGSASSDAKARLARALSRQQQIREALETLLAQATPAVTGLSYPPLARVEDDLAPLRGKALPSIEAALSRCRAAAEEGQLPQRVQADLAQATLSQGRVADELERLASRLSEAVGAVSLEKPSHDVARSEHVKTGAAEPFIQPREPGRRGGPPLSTPAASSLPGPASLPSEIWGHLPESARLEADQYAQERFMPRYAELLRRYYTTIGEKTRRK